MSRSLLLIYLMVTLVIGGLVYYRSGPLLLCFPLAAWVFYVISGYILTPIAESGRDDAYLFYLGVSGVRMVFFLSIVGLAVWFLPEARNRGAILLATVGYLFMMGAEVQDFVRKLRRDS